MQFCTDHFNKKPGRFAIFEPNADSSEAIMRFVTNLSCRETELAEQSEKSELVISHPPDDEFVKQV